MYAEHILNHVELGSLSSALLPSRQYSDSRLKRKRSEKRNSSSMAKIVMFSFLFKHQGVYLHKPGGAVYCNLVGIHHPQSERHMTEIPQ